ncbi:NAD(P)/FAD-dependent oxidoreductase [Blautia sp. MSJ-19]|uniref:NAD(P)/FAD-dependent oxidoreductase n=1 Tax=Blautia sp. MSJ-19 TaxID=2841517 RepID=UPI001C0F3844|nr:NAD(P)/FAD-dependent oxidoreductase [Blautia sp. MSJ-19]MBU5482655.1 NAD(P)/FAD-dependent oxidoreductase [Blautia sp. MSJ-19]
MEKYDVLIIGAGVTGTAVARELSRYQLKIGVLEREEDVCCGTSKANSAIVHAGYDAEPGTLKAKMNVRGNQLIGELAQELDFPFRRNGSLVLCLDEKQYPALQKLYEKGIANGVKELRILSREEVLEMEPNVTDQVVAALYAPTGGIVCPFHMTIAFAENACENGVTFHFNTEVKTIFRKQVADAAESPEQTDIEKMYLPHDTGTWQLVTSSGIFEAKCIINAAGIYADYFHNMVSEKKIHITPRKGEYCLLDKTAGTHVDHTIFALPGKFGKGVLVTPTVHGNLLIGPTATDIENKEGINTTREGLDEVLTKSTASVKNIPTRQVITSFAGLRAHSDGDDFIIEEAVKDFIDCAGIESPGLSSAPAIGEMVAEILRKKYALQEKDNFISTRKGMKDFQKMTLEERNEQIRHNPAYGNIICRCEMVTEGEIMDAIHRPLGARSLDGIKRRTRAGMGRCQAGFCSPRTMEILARELQIPIEEITKSGRNSQIIKGTNKSSFVDTFKEENRI